MNGPGSIWLITVIDIRSIFSWYYWYYQSLNRGLALTSLLARVASCDRKDYQLKFTAPITIINIVSPVLRSLEFLISKVCSPWVISFNV